MTNDDVEELRRDFDSFLFATFDKDKEDTSDISALTASISSGYHKQSTSAGKGSGNAILQAPPSKHYFSHKIAHRAFLAPAPKLVKPTIQQSPSPFLLPSEDKRLVPSPLLSESSVLEDMPKKVPDAMSRRLPLVVIPRRRKHKNYVSRRRNTQILASLRKCNSDPNVYRSYNSWEGLVAKDVQKPSVITAVLKTTNERTSANFEKATNGPRKYNLPAQNTVRSRIQKPQEVKEVEKPKEITRTQNLHGSGFKIPNISTNTNVGTSLSGLTSGVPKQVNLKKNQQGLVPDTAAVNCTPSTSGSNLVSSPPDSLPTSAVPSPQPPVITPKHSFAVSGLRRTSSKKKNKIDDLSSIKKELLESAAKLELAKKKIPGLNSGKNEKEESATSDEFKAKNMVNAISAAFSNVKVDDTNKTKNDGANVSQKAAKPPTTPSSARREIQNPPTPKLKLKNVAGPTQPKKTPPPQKNPEIAVPEKFSSDEEEDKRELKKEGNSHSKNLKDTIAQVEAALAEEERIKPPILQLSKQPIAHHGPPISIPGAPLPKKSFNPHAVNLLSSLQLPPSVSAKVDKIIAGGGKKLTTVRVKNI